MTSTDPPVTGTDPPVTGTDRRLLARLVADDTVTLDRLRARLAGRAAAGDLLDVAYRTVPTPVGSLLLAATTTGLVRVAFADEDHSRVLGELAERISPRILHAPARLDLAARQLDEYFARRRRRFELPLDWRLSRGFRRRVLAHLGDIGYGSTASYAAVAAAVGNSRAARAVGTACATNPLPVVVPCHRVVRSDGSLGGYGGGVSVKQTLLRLEGAGEAPQPGRRVPPAGRGR